MRRHGWCARQPDSFAVSELEDHGEWPVLGGYNHRINNVSVSHDGRSSMARGCGKSELLGSARTARNGHREPAALTTFGSPDERAWPRPKGSITGPSFASRCRPR